MERRIAAPLISMSRKEKVLMITGFAAISMVMLLMLLTPAFAASNYITTIRNIMNNMVTIVGVIFQAVGAILSIYAVGQLILAFKNEDANSKASASTLLVVGIVLIAVPGIINVLGLVNMIGS